MNWRVVIWAFVILLLVGGLIGFVKAKSRASLVASVLFAILLSFSASGILPAVTSPMGLGLLSVVFAIRLAKTRKMMPSGMMLLISIMTLGWVGWLMYKQ